MKTKIFRPGWVFYPHTGIAFIVFSEEDLAEQEASMGNGEYIREATIGEQDYQTSGIPEMVAQYHSIIEQSQAITEAVFIRKGRKNAGLAS